MILISMLAACGAEPPRLADDAEGRALSRVAVDVLAREACPRLLVRTFSLEDSARDTTGKLWVRRCETRSTTDALDVDLDVLGWQWAAESSWGFAIGEYVYFTATIHGRLDAQIDGAARLRIASREDPRVEVRAIGRVGARAETPASSLLGIASALVGKGANDLATSALRGRVRDLIRDRARSGFAIALGDTPVPGATAKGDASFLDEKQALFPGGALLSGSYPRDVDTDLRWNVRDGELLARAVCVDTATSMVDATMAGTPREASDAPADVLTLRGSGSKRLPARPCAWVLVTGTSGGQVARASLSLSVAPPIARHTAHRWVKATVLAYDIAKKPDEAKLFSFSIGTDAGLRTIGRPLVEPRSRSLRLVAPPVEIVQRGAIVVRVASLRPLPPASWWNAQSRYDETELGRGTLSPAIENGHEERDVAIEDHGTAIGSARIALDVMEVE